MIRVENLTRHFGDHTALGDVSFEIDEGETFALLGPNGSGKTTTLKCMAGLIEPSCGRVFINGIDVRKNSRAARFLTSYLPQRVTFPESLTAREVLQFYCDLRKLPARRVDETLANTRLNLNGFGGKPVGKYSGGMTQKLGLAVACLPDAPILMLDEPTASLDPEGAIRFRESLLALKRQGKTLVFTSHVLADIEHLADRVGILVGGKLVALESIEALRAGRMRSSRLRVQLKNDPSGLRRILSSAGGIAGVSSAQFDGNALLVTSRPEDWLGILENIKRLGGQVVNFATEEQSLEDIYLNYVNDYATVWKTNRNPIAHMQPADLCLQPRKD